MELSDVAGNVRAELARQRRSQRELQQHLGISRVTLYRRLSGESPFDVDELRKIAELLHVSVSDLLGEERASA
jgi:transcriptional regulator with XRE-family HTH domain